jgi:hypothetical protein
MPQRIVIANQSIHLDEAVSFEISLVIRRQREDIRGDTYLGLNTS